MHSFMRAVGFSNIKSRSDLDQLFSNILKNPTNQKTQKTDYQISIAEISKDFSDFMGVTLRGEYDDEGKFHLEHYFPYFKGHYRMMKEEIVVNKRVDTEAYTGMCDDIRLGVSLIFYLQNVIEYMEIQKKRKLISYTAPLKLAALSVEGKILLGIDKTPHNSQKISHEKKRRSKLIQEAKLGNQEAIDSLTIDDIDLYTLISKRAKYEDIYSIVETSFVPFGSESDNYSVLGTIIEVNEVINSYSKETVYQLTIECNDINFGICINKQDLEGVPEVGRRFKGNIWLQGEVDFS
ncbi:hypothetical protein lbkm_3309 [Lachnospiraceae bacterium KM106-2]|nr:hypothetical protein lbkm_3309 [Lachnospiraceae bacterium KM106-2]